MDIHCHPWFVWLEILHDYMVVCFVFPTSDTSSLNEPVLQEQVEKLNRQNTEHSHGKAEADNERGEERGSGGRRQKPAELILDGPHASAAQSEERKKATTEKEEEEDVFEHSESEEGEEKGEDVSPEQAVKVQDDGKKKHIGEAEESSKSEKAPIVIADVLPQERYWPITIQPHAIVAHKVCQYCIYCCLYFFLFIQVTEVSEAQILCGKGKKTTTTTRKTNKTKQNCFLFLTCVALRRSAMWPLAANVVSQKKTC